MDSNPFDPRCAIDPRGKAGDRSPCPPLLEIAHPPLLLAAPPPPPPHLVFVPFRLLYRFPMLLPKCDDADVVFLEHWILRRHFLVVAAYELNELHVLSMVFLDLYG